MPRKTLTGRTTKYAIASPAGRLHRPAGDASRRAALAFSFLDCGVQGAQAPWRGFGGGAPNSMLLVVPKALLGPAGLRFVHKSPPANYRQKLQVTIGQ